MCDILVIVIIPGYVTIIVITSYCFSILSPEIRKRKEKRNQDFSFILILWDLNCHTVCLYYYNLNSKC